MNVEIGTEYDPDLDGVLGRGLYEFNSKTTGIYDGTLLNAAIRNEDGDIVAGISGHTWGGCCEITRLWVHETLRGRGVGTELMHAAEEEARRRGCRQMVLSTHSFQAPAFYERLGFRRLAAVADYPQGHESIMYVKALSGAL